MKNMRTFNPMLSVLSVGELLLTPRGLFALGKRSLRTVRQQVRALEDVGEELVVGGRDALSGLALESPKAAARLAAPAPKKKANPKSEQKIQPPIDPD
jgi:hypothetical protein